MLHTFTVSTRLPERLSHLEELAYNLIYCWQPKIGSLFRRIDPMLWEETRHNPVLLLSRLNHKRLTQLEEDESFLAFLNDVYKEFKEYQTKEPVFLKDTQQPFVAYFSAEYGLTECLPFYSGGLGVLAGDFLKCGSDLNLPIVGVGLLYQHGYFVQSITTEGYQKEIFPEMDFYHMPLKLERDKNGQPITIDVKLKGEKAIARIWRLNVGRIPLYLLDTNVKENPEHIQKITSQLYVADREMRLRQEILLGIGGVRAIKALGLRPTVFHMNEGHSAFAGLERIRVLREETGLSFEASHLLVMAGNVFTTHTSVPAGIEIFDPGLIQAYFSDYVSSLGISLQTLLGLGRRNPQDQNEPFCMNVLAMKLSGHINAVSKAHKEVSDSLWHDLWPSIPVEDVPICYITNGIHIPSWISVEMSDLYRSYLGPGWMEQPDVKDVWSRALEIPDEELWGIHERCRERLVAFCRRRLERQLRQKGATGAEIASTRQVLNPEAFTIVWARRMASYKRPALIFKDPERLARILNNEDHPAQLIIAGKAHPADEEGKALIRQILTIINQEVFRNKIVFIENYDIEVAHYLVQGADLWLNTPLPPNEASGTSGMKAVANGALHISSLDGWWVEAYRPGLGWVIGNERYEDRTYQDEMDSKSLYNLLEDEIIPLFYDRGVDGLPRNWIKKMKASMRELCSIFNGHLAIQEYVQKLYIPAQMYVEKLSKDGAKGANELARWRSYIMENWRKVSVVKVEQHGPREPLVGDRIEIKAWVYLDEIDPSDVRVDLYYGPIDPQRRFIERKIKPMRLCGQNGENTYQYSTEILCEETGGFGYRIRLMPYHENLVPSCYILGQLVNWG